VCLLAPALEAGHVDGVFVAAGRIVGRASLGPDARAAVENALAAARAALAEGPAHEPDHLDELLVVGAFVRRPPPEVRVLPLDRDRILARLAPPLAAAA
jgi:hypothetical protein